MLASQRIIAFLATTNAARARAFYRDALGLSLVSEDAFALVFDAGGTMLRVTPTREFVAAPHTVLGWEVDDIQTVARALKQSQVPAERYHGMDHDADGVWLSPSGAKVMWIKDRDGNILSLTQF